MNKPINSRGREKGTGTSRKTEKRGTGDGFGVKGKEKWRVRTEGEEMKPSSAARKKDVGERSPDTTRLHWFSEARQLDRLLIRQYPSVSDSFPLFFPSPSTHRHHLSSSSSFFIHLFKHLSSTTIYLSPSSPRPFHQLSLSLSSTIYSRSRFPPHSISPVSATSSTLIIPSHSCPPPTHTKYLQHNKSPSVPHQPL